MSNSFGSLQRKLAERTNNWLKVEQVIMSGFFQQIVQEIERFEKENPEFPGEVTLEPGVPVGGGASVHKSTVENTTREWRQGMLLYTGGNHASKHGRLDLAIKLDQEALERGYIEPSVYNNLASIQKKQGKYSEALSSYTKALELDESYLVGYLRAASLVVTYISGSNEMAIEMMRNYFLHGGTDEMVNQFIAGRPTAEEQERFREFFTVLRFMMDPSPEKSEETKVSDSNGYLQRNWSKVEQVILSGSFQQIVQEIERFLKENPEFPGEVILEPGVPREFSLGMLLYSAGLYASKYDRLNVALNLFQEALERGYILPLIYYNLASIQKKQGKYSDALSSYTEALKLNESNLVGYLEAASLVVTYLSSSKEMAIEMMRNYFLHGGKDEMVYQFIWGMPTGEEQERFKEFFVGLSFMMDPSHEKSAFIQVAKSEKIPVTKKWWQFWK